MRPFGSARRSIRLAASAYTHGAFFVTICTHQRRHLFGSVVGDGTPRVELSSLGRIVVAEWRRSGEIRREIRLDVFIVMPNHVHGIVWINADAAPVRRSRFSLAAFVAATKSAVTREARRQHVHVGPTWQRNYFERIVRNETELTTLREYITANPIRWLRHV